MLSAWTLYAGMFSFPGFCVTSLLLGVFRSSSLILWSIAKFSYKHIRIISHLSLASRYNDILIGHVTDLSRCPSDRKTKIGVNVPRDRSNRCANFQFSGSKKRQKNLQKMTHISRQMFTYGQRTIAGQPRHTGCSAAGGYTGAQWAP